MSDHSELKRLAEAALRNWPDSKLFERPECERFIDASRPDVVLALISEVDGLHAQHGRDSGELRKVCAARDSARRQRDQLKAENEALRKHAERYRWLMSSAVMNGTLGIQDGWIDFEFKDEAQENIDAAMGKGEQSCGPRQNTGHGHVFPRADGVRARCGGPGLCKECSVDKSRKDAQR